MIGARKGGGGYRRSPGGGSMNKKNPSGGGVSPMGVFLCGQSFLSTYAGAMPFFPCVGGGSPFLLWGGGGALLGLPPPHNNFCGSLLSQKSFQIVEGLIFFEGAIRSTQKLAPPAPAPI